MLFSLKSKRTVIFHDIFVAFTHQFWKPLLLQIPFSRLGKLSHHNPPLKEWPEVEVNDARALIPEEELGVPGLQFLLQEVKGVEDGDDALGSLLLVVGVHRAVEFREGLRK